MSGSQASTITVASPPTTEEVAADFLGWMGAQNEVVTDVNEGSQVRTFAEAVGSVVDTESVSAQALAFQALVYSAFAAFQVFPIPAQPATTTLTFGTGAGANPPPVPVAVGIPQGTITQTVGGIQFQTLENATIPAGGTSVTVPAAAVVAGAAGNVAIGTITQILSSIPYTLVVNNLQAATGGADAETPAATLARFTAVVGSIGLGTPVAVANAAIGVTVSGTGETVRYATCYEPWIAQLMAGVQNPAAGFQVYVDNGSGTASSDLLAAVAAKLDGDFALNLLGNRPAGVPYQVKQVVPVLASVVVSGVVIQPGAVPAVTSSTQTALNNYYATLNFGDAAQLSQIIADVASAVQASTSSLSITLLDANGNSQSVIPTGPTQRIIPGAVVINFTGPSI
jgi:uncharacterized phage protein gp47/JayE